MRKIYIPVLLIDNLWHQLNQGKDGITDKLESYGNRLMDPYQKDIISTIRTVTIPITQSKTLIVNWNENIFQCTQRRCIKMKSTGRGNLSILLESDRLPRNGIPPQRDVNGIVNTPSKPMQNGSQRNISVNVAGCPLQALNSREFGSVPTNVNQNNGDKITPDITIRRNSKYGRFG